MSNPQPAEFNVCRRYSWIIQQYNKTNFDIASDLKEYARLAQLDIGKMLAYGFGHFFPITKKVRDDIKISIDIYEFRFFAKVIRHRNDYEIVISIGALLAIDDAVTISLLRWFPNVKPRLNNYPNVNRITTRFYDYSFLLDKNLDTNGNHPFVTICPVIYDTFEQLEYRAIVSNFSILWLILHELAHIQLGHFDRLKKANSNFQFSEFFNNPVENNQNSKQIFEDMILYEFAADFYANLKWFATFFRKDSVGKIFPSIGRNNPEAALLISLFCVCLPSLLLHRSQESFFWESGNKPSTHPIAQVRLFNSMTICSMALKHVELVMSPVSVHINKQDLTIHIDFLSVGMVYFELIPLFDWLLYEMRCKPFLPRETKAKKFSLKAFFNRPVDANMIQREMNEIVIALLTSSYTGSKWSSKSSFKPYHDNWKNILTKSFEFWKEDIDLYKLWDQSKIWEFAVINDLDIPMIYKYFATIMENMATKQNNVSLKETAIVEASNLVNLLVGLKIEALNKK